MKTAIQSPRVSTDLTQVEDFITWKKNMDEEELIEGLLIMGDEVQGESFYKLDLAGTRINRCRFQNCDFEKAAFVDVIFENCDFSNSDLSSAYFHRCQFQNSKCLGADFHEASFKEVTFTDTVLNYANMTGAMYENVRMEQCDLTEAAMSEIKHKKWTADRCSFYGTNFFRTMLRGFNFSENEMADIVVSESMEELRGSTISPVQALEAAKLLGMRIV